MKIERKLYLYLKFIPPHQICNIFSCVKTPKIKMPNIILKSISNKVHHHREEEKIIDGQKNSQAIGEDFYAYP